MDIQEIVALSGKTPKKQKKLRPVQSSLQLELEYFRTLKKLANEMKGAVRKELLPVLEKGKAEFQADSISDELAAVFSVLKRKADGLAIEAEAAGESIVEKVASLNRKRFVTSANKSLGVDLEGVLSETDLADVIKAQSEKNISLIKSIPDEFFKNIETTVYNGVAEGNSFEQIAKVIVGIKGISSIFGKLDNRVKAIARNEVSNINGAITKKRQESLGIDTYIWSTAQDERVRDSHRVMEGKTCRWDDPTVYLKGDKWVKRSGIGGVEKHPSFDFGCRCTAEAIINFEEE